MSAHLRPRRIPEVSLATLRGSVVEGRTGSGGSLQDGTTDALVCGVSLDSRQVRLGDLYAALPGQNAHGASYAAAAVAAGARAVLTDARGAALLDDNGVHVPRIVVDDPRAVLGRIAAQVYGHPADHLDLVGITGTNGKTTTAYILDAALRALGRTTGLIGTIETRVADRAIPSVRTTPEACDLQALFAAMVQEGVDTCVMEVSSHALSLHRVDGMRFGVAVFTNLSQDHLDFHGTVEDYFLAKAGLFTPARARRGIVCVDDAWGARLARESAIPVVTVATDAADAGGAGGAGGAAPDWRIETDDAGRGEFRLVGSGASASDSTFGQLRLLSALPGAHNRANTAFAALVLLELGFPRPDVERALRSDPRVPGRMERVVLPAAADGASAPMVYVDFAHTPEAVRATLAALRPTTSGRIIAVIGAGGHRDAGKRPLMGAAAARGADLIVVTDDNPRDEEPATIRAAVAAGAREALLADDRDPREAVHDVDRRFIGIGTALRLAAPGDVVAVLGRGHESHQEVMGQLRPFDDREAVARAWSQILEPAS